jgi:hypothetical protein
LPLGNVAYSSPEAPTQSAPDEADRRCRSPPAGSPPVLSRPCRHPGSPPPIWGFRGAGSGSGSGSPPSRWRWRADVELTSAWLHNARRISLAAGQRRMGSIRGLATNRQLGSVNAMASGRSNAPASGPDIGLPQAVAYNFRYTRYPGRHPTLGLGAILRYAAASILATAMNEAINFAIESGDTACGPRSAGLWNRALRPMIET